MYATIDEITIAFEEDGIETVRQLDKHILSKGAWTTIMFRYQDWEKAKNAFGPVKYSVRRYQKRNNQYWMKSKFSISSVDQAKKLVGTLNEWLALEE